MEYGPVEVSAVQDAQSTPGMARDIQDSRLGVRSGKEYGNVGSCCSRCGGSDTSQPGIPRSPDRLGLARINSARYGFGGLVPRL